MEVINSMNTRYGNIANGANNPQNLGICHSMGGLMLREVDRITGNGTKKFGGYITVTSPNYSAPISNSLLDGSVERAAQNAFLIFLERIDFETYEIYNNTISIFHLYGIVP